MEKRDFKDLIKMSKDQLLVEIDNARNELLRVRYEVSIGKERNIRKPLIIRRNIAKMLTALNQKDKK